MATSARSPVVASTSSRFPRIKDVYLGSGATPDRRQSPYFRTEWLQSVMNLTTVRSHQFAVWITIGFFEVKRQGKPELAISHPTLACRPARQGDRLAGRPRMFAIVRSSCSTDHGQAA